MNAPMPRGTFDDNPLGTRRKHVTIRHATKRRRLLDKVRQRRLRAKRKAKAEALYGIRTYEELIHALKVYRQSLGISQEFLNQIAGFQDGYVNKLEVGYKEGGRGMGAMSMTTWLDALGVRLAVVPK